MLALMTLAGMASLSEAVTRQVKVKYFTAYTFPCLENGTIPTGSKVFWITHDSQVVDNRSRSSLPNHIGFVNDNDASILNITYINDDLFGYYTCVMIDENDTVTLTRWGLNVDGADFSDLERQYRDNAIVGAIAAAAMLVLLGSGCIIWNYRYSRRLHDEFNNERKENSGSNIEEDDDPKKYASASTTELYHNKGFDADEAVEGGVTGVEATVNGSAELDGRPHSEHPEYRM